MKKKFSKFINKKIIYKYVISATVYRNKAYIGMTKGDFDQCYYNHKKSFKNKSFAKDTFLRKYFLEIR